MFLSLCLLASALSAGPAAPPGTRRVAGGSYTAELPDGWELRGDGRLVTPAGSGIIGGVSDQAFQGDLDALLRIYEPSIVAGQLQKAGARTLQRDGVTWLDVTYERAATGVDVALYGRVAVAAERVALQCGTTPERKPGAEGDCRELLGTLRLGEAGPAPAGKRVLAGKGWSLVVPADWAEQPDQPPGMRMFTSPQRGIAPIFLSVTAGPAQGDLQATADVFLSRLAAGTHGRVVHRQDAAIPGGTAVDFTLAAHQGVPPAFMQLRLSTQGGRGLGMVCGSQDRLDAGSRAQCDRALESLRWRK